MTELIKLIPSPDTLPVSSFWFRLLLYLTYYLHLIGTGIMLGLSFAVIFGYIRGKTTRKWSGVKERMAKILPFSIAFAINLGVAPLLFVQVLYGNFFYPATIFIGIFWIFLILLLIAGYYGAYWVKFKTGKDLINGKFISIFVFCVLIWTGFIMVNVHTLMMKPKIWKSYFNHMGGFFLNTGDPTLIPRVLFYIFLLLSIGGLFISVFYKIRSNLREAKNGMELGNGLTLYSLLSAVPFWFIYIFILPETVRMPFTSGDMFWTGLNLLFILGMFITAYLSYKKFNYAVTIAMLLNMILFVFVRNHIRDIFLSDYSSKFPVLSSNTQNGVMVLFFISLAAGLLTIGWMLIKSYKEFGKQE